MARRRLSQDSSVLEILLLGYEQKKREIEEEIRKIQGQIGGRRGRPPSRSAVKQEDAPKKRTLSEAARRRIAAAQKRRWAEHRKKTAQNPKSE